MSKLVGHWIGCFLIVFATALAGWLWVDAMLTPGFQVLPSVAGPVVLGIVASMAMTSLED